VCIRKVGVRIDDYAPWGFLRGGAIDELEKLVARLMAAVRNMPPGQQRQDSLKEIGRLRFRMDTLLRSASSSQSLAKDERSSVGKLTKPTKATKNKQPLKYCLR
jgi:hypothetical protein